MSSATTATAAVRVVSVITVNDTITVAINAAAAATITVVINAAAAATINDAINANDAAINAINAINANDAINDVMTAAINATDASNDANDAINDAIGAASNARDAITAAINANDAINDAMTAAINAVSAANAATTACPPEASQAPVALLAWDSARYSAILYTPQTAVHLVKFTVDYASFGFCVTESVALERVVQGIRGHGLCGANYLDIAPPEITTVWHTVSFVNGTAGPVSAQHDNPTRSVIDTSEMVRCIRLRLAQFDSDDKARSVSNVPYFSTSHAVDTSTC